MIAILARTTLATLAAFAGGLLGIALGQRAARHLTALVYAALGALLAVTLFDVLPDAKGGLSSWPLFLMAVASGYGLFWLVGRFLYSVCPACSLGTLDARGAKRLGTTTILLLAALAIHSTTDGLAVAVGDEITGRPNLAVLLAVSFHKLPEGLALALMLLGVGYARRTALAWTFAIEATTELGGLFGVFALRALSPVWLALVFAHVGGGFLYLVGSTLTTFARQTPRLPARSLLVGVSLAFSVTAVLLTALRVHAH